MASSGALQPALSLVCQSIRDAARQGVAGYDAGVVVYNVLTATRNPTMTLLSLKQPQIDDLKALIRIASSEDLRNEKFTPGSSSEGDDALINVLRVAKSELNQLHTRSLRRVLIITNNSDPYNGNEEKRKVAANLSIDITDSPAQIEPVFIDTGHFDPEKFWNTLSYIPPFYAARFGNGGSDDPLRKWNLEPIKVDSLSSAGQFQFLTKSRKKYVAFRGRLMVGSIPIGVTGFRIVTARARIPTGRKIAIVDDGEDQHREILVNERKPALAESGAEISTTNATKAFVLSGSMNQADWIVSVSDSELEKLVDVDSNSATTIQISEFVPHPLALQTQYEYGSVGRSVLVVPSNDRITNSSRAFASLHRSMVRKNVAAVGIMQFPKSRKSPPVLGVLYAADPPKLYEEQHELKPGTSSGMFFVPLPFNDDIRTGLNTHANLLASAGITEQQSELVDFLKTVLRKFRLPIGFDPYRFPHPKTAQFAEILERHALSVPIEFRKIEDHETDIPMEQPDRTRPRYAKIAKTSSNLLGHINNVFNEMSVVLNTTTKSSSTTGRKRATANNAADGSSRKKLRPLSEPGAILEAIESGSLERYTVRDLQDVLAQHGDPPKRDKKADLVLRVKALAEGGAEPKPEVDSF